MKYLQHSYLERWGWLWITNKFSPEYTEFVPNSHPALLYQAIKCSIDHTSHTVPTVSQ